MKTKSFKDCTLEYLEDTFGLMQKFKSSILDNWMNTPIQLNAHEKLEVQMFQEILQLNVLHWNEQELSLHFIGPMFSIAKLSSQQYNLFAQRLIGTTVQDIELSGRPDGILASGFRSPKKPFFAFQEYKKEGDPAGQTLAAMLVGRELNKGKHPIYGAYVIGRDWYFMVLEGKNYVISQDFSAVTDDVFQILRMLKALKQIVIDALKNTE